MKKKVLIGILVVLALVFVMASCGSGTKGSSESPQRVESVKQERPTKNFNSLGDYEVVIKGATLAEDYEGNPAVIVTYDWSNNSEDTKASYVAVAMKCFQDGVELDSAIVMDDEVYDASNYLKEVRPGTTIEIQQAFKLTSTTSIVEIEVTEWLSFSDDMIEGTFDPTK